MHDDHQVVPAGHEVTALNFIELGDALCKAIESSATFRSDFHFDDSHDLLGGKLGGIDDCLVAEDGSFGFERANGASDFVLGGVEFFCEVGKRGPRVRAKQGDEIFAIHGVGLTVERIFAVFVGPSGCGPLVEKSPAPSEEIASGVESVFAAEHNHVKSADSGKMFVTNRPGLRRTRCGDDDATSCPGCVAGFDTIDFVNAEECVGVAECGLRGAFGGGVEGDFPCWLRHVEPELGVAHRIDGQLCEIGRCGVKGVFLKGLDSVAVLEAGVVHSELSREGIHLGHEGVFWRR